MGTLTGVNNTATVIRSGQLCDVCVEMIYESTDNRIVLRQYHSNRSDTDYSRTAFDSEDELPQWVREDIALLKWLPAGEECSLGRWHERSNHAHPLLKVYQLYSPEAKERGVT